MTRQAAAAETPNLADYAEACRTFSWDAARRDLDGLPGGRGLNIAHEAVDRHVAAGRGERVALRWLAKGGGRRDLTYADLARLSSRFANVLRELGVGRGERVFAFAGRIPALYAAALGTLKNGSVFCPMFSAFGPEPARQRLAIGEARVLVTTEQLYRKKIEQLRDELPALEHVLVAGPGEPPEGTLSLDLLMEAANDTFEIPATDPEDPALLHFTSGTTGTPKGARARARGGRRAPRDRLDGARPAPGRRLLVHRRPGLGHRHLLRDHLAAHELRHDGGRRGRVRRRALVLDARA